MKVISFVGNVDKRILVLPVARGLSFLGETLIVTDDPNYLRATKNNIIAGIKVLFSCNIDDKLVDNYDDGVDYQNIIYDTREFIPATKDSLIVCRHKDRTLMVDKIKEVTDDIDKNGDVVTESNEIVITYYVDKKELKKAHYTERGEHTDILGKADILELKPLDMRWLWLCEETASIPGMKNSSIIGEMAKILCKKLNMSEKECAALLSRES